MYAEFILKIVVLQVAGCIKLCLISVGYRTVVHLIPYHDIYSQSSTIYVVSTRSKLIMSSVTFKLNLYL